jgi:hypothetical protein
MTEITVLRESWGPRFWRIFHTLAECSGTLADLLSSRDEAEVWILLLKLQANVMPCKICKEHYTDWLSTHAVERVRYLEGQERREWLRHWFWACHEHVNRMNGKPTPPEEDLPNLYPRRSIQKEIVELGTMFQLAVEKRLLSVDDTLRWRQLLSRLRAMYGV